MKLNKHGTKCKLYAMSNKGITLVALIVTIVVLLILAGITIAAISSNNNVPEKAKYAKDEHERSTELNDIETAVTASIKETGYNSEVDISKLKQNISGLVSNNNLDTLITGEGPWVVTGKTGKIYKIANDGDVKAYTPTKIKENSTEVELTIDNIKDYIGKTVASVTINNETVNFGLFYVDFEGKYGEAGTVYLRAKGILSTITTLDTVLSSDNQAIAVPIMKKLNPSWSGGNRGNTAYGSMQNNEKGAVYLCNPNNSLWVGTVSGTDTDPSILKAFKEKYGASNVNYIIGAPSVELYLASYNAKYSSVYSAEYKPSDKTYPGYLYSNNGGTSNTTLYSGAITNSDGGMYKQSSSYSNTSWLASPQSGNSGDSGVCAVGSNGDLLGYSWNYTLGVAPLVSLKDGVTLETIE